MKKKGKNVNFNVISKLKAAESALKWAWTQ